MPILTTPLRAIKAFCAECSGGPRKARRCSKESCPLHTYRRGRNPARKGRPGGNPASLAKARLAKNNSAVKTGL